MGPVSVATTSPTRCAHVACTLEASVTPEVMETTKVGGAHASPVTRQRRQHASAAGRDAVADQQALGEAEGFELAHVELERGRLLTSGSSKVGRSHTGLVGD